tara:strand:- start:2006 stop:2836 length:831 start_codon:yes stop_codon:yes gene_type:complete
LRVFSTHKELLKSIDSNKLVGLVPTMGSLHDGHLHLIRRAIIENQQTIISIYVNPTQFNNKYDLIQYPRNLEEDLRKLKDFKNIFIYAPSDNDLYEDVISKSFDFDDLDKILEGKYRPGHFKGVATIVEKLFNLFNPNNAYFGEKDFQQLSIVKLMTKKLNLNVNVIACKTIREADGLAMSSRNKLMTKEERFYAGEISKLMIEAKQMYLKNKNENIENIYDVVKNEFNKLKHCKLEYFEVENLSKYSSSIEDEGYRIFVACWIGRIRIIDNIALK